MLSIRGRLSIGLTLVLALLLLGQWLWLTLTIDRLIEKQLITRLQEETESVLANIKVDDSGHLSLENSQLSSSYQRVFSGLYFKVTSGQQQLLSRSLWDFDLITDQISHGQKHVDYPEGPRDQSLLAVSAGYLKQEQQITITVAEDIQWMLDDKHQLQFVFSLLSASGLIVLLLIQAGMIRQALKPLYKARQQLAQLGQGDITRIDEQAPAEIRPLLAELNRLMNSMVIKTRRSRQALGNLAHRLKTQLSLLNQVADSDSLDDIDHVRSSIYQQTADIRQIIDRELKRARVAGLTLPGKVINLEQLTTQLVDTLKQIYRDKPLQIDWHVDDDVHFNGDREDMLELLGNLLDNACKWCRHRVMLRITMDKGLKLEVADDGPGCDTANLTLLCQRGFRADESRPGSGLGLAIVGDIVDSYNGRIEFGPSLQWGGLQVTVHLQTDVDAQG